MAKKIQATVTGVEVGGKEVVINLGDLEGPYDAPVYANHAQLYVTVHEITIDFYWIGSRPAPSSGGDSFAGKLIQRIIIPLHMGKGLATALTNLVDVKDREFGHALPMSRTAPPEDTIQIWDDNGILDLQHKQS